MKHLRLSAAAVLPGTFAVLAVVLALAAAPASANVYATDLRFSTPATDATAGGASVDLSFRLNEPADSGATIEILRADTNAVVRTVPLGAKPRGLSTWTWDLTNGSGTAVPTNVPYYFKVTASDDGHAAWTLISSPNDQACKFGTSWAVDVDKDPSRATFGRIYCTSTWVGSTSMPPDPQRTTTRGMYALNADCTDAIGQGDNAMDGGITWTHWLSPFNVKVGPEGKLYICSNADAISGAWIANPDLAGSWTALLAPGVGEVQYFPYAAAPPAVHGSVAAAVPVGKGLNRKLVWSDEDLMVPGDNDQNPKSIFSLWQYPLGPIDKTITKSPTIFWQNDYTLTKFVNLDNHSVGDFSDLTRDKDGNWFYSAYSWGGTYETSLLKIAPDGNPAGSYVPLFNSLSVWGAPDPALMNVKGVAVDDARNRIATVATWGDQDGISPGTVHIFNTNLDKATLQSITLYTPDTVNQPNRPRGVAFDAVGNVYVVDHNTELLTVYAPPDGANSYTTPSAGRFVPTNGSAAVPGAPVVTAPATTSSNSQLSASWTATGPAYRYAIGVTPDDQGDYVVGWTDTPSTSVTHSSFPSPHLLNGVTYFWYVKAKSANNVLGPTGASAGTLVAGIDRIGSAKAKAPDEAATLEQVVVTKTGPTEFWVQEKDRSAGIRIISSANPPINVVVAVAGTVKEDAVTREKYLDAGSNSVTTGAAFTATPIVLQNDSVGGRAVTGGVGLPSDGLYVKVYGKYVKDVFDFNSGNVYLYINDGSDVPNDTTDAGIRILKEGGPTVGAGDYISAVGIVRLVDGGSGTIIRQLEPRAGSAIVKAN